jgi:hypothetical protein
MPGECPAKALRADGKRQRASEQPHSGHDANVGFAFAFALRFCRRVLTVRTGESASSSWLESST